MKKVTKAVAALMLMTALACVAGCNKPNDPNNGGNGTYNGHEYVDLGLPSGTLWAACNIGADMLESYGDYFAWGETQSKSNYDWSTYRYCEGGHYQITKYCNNGDFGFNEYVDNKTVLEQSDDAAAVCWEGDWRLPTKAEWDELKENCTSNWTTLNGINGRLFTSSNGNSLFLPASGYFRGESIEGVGACGYYWSDSLGLDNPSAALDFYFDLVNSGVNTFYRCNGLPIRPVHSAN